MDGLLSYLSPDEQRMAMQNARTQGLLGLGAALLQSSTGAPGQGKPRLGQILGQALPVGMQAYQGGIDQTLQQILVGQKMQEMQRQREMQARQQQAQARLAAGLSPEQQEQVAAFGPDVLQKLTMPPPEEAYTLSPGQTRFWGGQQVAALPAAPETKVLKPGDVLVKGEEIVFQVEPDKKPTDYIRQDLGNSVAFIDPTTLKTVKIITKDKDQKDLSSGEDSTRKEFLAQAKPYIEISQAYRKIEEATKVPSAAGDVSLVFAFMKILDPGSVVREGEFATAQNAAGVPDRIRAQYNQAMSGQKLAPAQREDFLNQAKNLARSQKQMFESQLLPQYQYISQDRGYDLNKVISNPFQGLSLETGQRAPAGQPGQPRKSLDSIFGGGNRGTRGGQ
jgi:hypothetical protein